MKAQMGTDRTGPVHTLVTTRAGAVDIAQLPQLLHGTERDLLRGPGLLERGAPHRGQ
jgi:IS5 family transposase